MKRELLLALSAAVLLVAGNARAVTPAERQIAEAREAVAAQPTAASGYTGLALALARRAREVSSYAYYDEASAALDRAQALAPDDFEAARTRAAVLLGQQDFAAALALATRLNQRFPDDLMTYALLVDANVELGNYAEAETAAQRMLDLRPGNLPGLARAANLREVFGDIEGALELVLAALPRVPPAEVQEQAWLLTRIGQLNLAAGRLDAAERAVAEALRVFPDYHYALGEVARLQAAGGAWAEALATERRHYRAAPHPENLYLLARVAARGGQAREAAKLFDDFTRQAQVASGTSANANRELIQYYADEGAQPRAALALAEQEIARRHDVHTLAAYAWALHRSGQARAAAEAIDRALAVGTRDADLLYQAGEIQAAAGAPARALELLRAALAAAPWHAQAAVAQTLLTQLTAHMVPTDSGGKT
nr:tetratricopeptide domain protein [uncultured bacterium]